VQLIGDDAVVKRFIQENVNAVDTHPNPSYPQRADRHNPYRNKAILT
jgi:hypothetical protein